MHYATSTDYLEENPTMPLRDLKRILKKHDYSLEEFQDEFGVHDEYDTNEVFGWMGY